jgi:hypothetical protein
MFYEHKVDGDYPAGCFENKRYCCCVREVSEWESGLSLPGITPGTVFPQEFNNEINKLKKCDSWLCSVGGLLVIMGIFTAVVLWVTGKIKGEGTSEYTKALANGMKIGLVCILLQVLGKWITGEEGEGSKFWENVGEGMTVFGNILYRACVFLARNFPALISLLTIVMRWMTFQMCVEDIERSLDQGYYGGTTGAEQYRSGLVGSQSALSRLQGCMTQFNQISQDAWMLGQSMVYSGTGLWGSASLKLTGSKRNRDLSNGGEICSGEQINFEVKNWCKVIMDSGNDAQYIFITSDSGKTCQKVPLYSAETCRSYYGGYGSYGYGSYGGWSGGLGTGSYRTLQQTPGKNQNSFSPLTLCNDGTENAHTYTLINPLRTITIKYNPGC